MGPETSRQSPGVKDVGAFLGRWAIACRGGGIWSRPGLEYFFMKSSRWVYFDILLVFLMAGLELYSEQIPLPQIFNILHSYAAMSSTATNIYRQMQTQMSRIIFYRPAGIAQRKGFARADRPHHGQLLVGRLFMTDCQGEDT